MKRTSFFVLMVTAGLLLAQSNSPSTRSFMGPETVAKTPPRDGKIPPPLNLGAAYDKAMLKLGADTNQFHCVSATCLPWLTHIAGADDVTGSSSGWTFVFLTPMESKEMSMYILTKHPPFGSKIQAASDDESNTLLYSNDNGEIAPRSNQ
jgi:hypothetical protein